MENFKAILTMSFLLIGFQQANALEIRSNANWKQVNMQNDRETLVDLNNLEDSGGKKYIFVKYDRPTTAEPEKSFYRKYAINCNSIEYLMTAEIAFDKPNLTGIVLRNQDFAENVSFKTVIPQSVAAKYVEFACGNRAAFNKTTNNTDGNISQYADLKYVKKLSTDEIRERLVIKTWDASILDSILFNYSFIHTFNKRMEELQKRKVDGNLVGYDETRKYQYFSPFFPLIKKSMIGMNSAITEISRKANIEPTVLTQSLGLYARVEDGYLDARNSKNDSATNKSIYNGAVIANSYFNRFPDKTNSVNEWYDSRDPEILFGSYYSEFINNFKYDASKFLETAKKYEAEQIAIAQKREDEKVAREKWLISPEGRKFLADEKKTEEIRLKAEAEEKLRSAKQLALEKAEKEKMKQDCLKITAWRSDSRELIATALKVPMSSISLVRTQLGEFDRCLAVIDTSKGPNKCLVMSIFQDKSSKEFAASFASPFGAVQAVCGGLAF